MEILHSLMVEDVVEVLVGVNKVPSAQNVLGMTLVEDKIGVLCGDFFAVQARAIVGKAGKCLEVSLHRMQGIAPLCHLLAPTTIQNLTCQ